MSLVNEVLRQLDNRSSLPEHSMPLQALVVNNKKSINFFRILFILLITILASIISAQWFYQQPLLNLFSTPQATEKTSEITKATAEPIVIAVEEAVNSEAIKSEAINSEAPSAVVIAIEDEIGGITANIAAVNIEAVVEGAESLAADLNRGATELIQIQRVEVPGLKQYQLALKAYKRKQSTTALYWINLAIAEQANEKYQLLKARVYLQQNDGDSFYELVLQQADNHSLSWYQLVAPGLQIFSYHELSNTYYTQLIKQQPKQVKWQLAMALNFSKLKQFDKTTEVYQSLLQSSLLSNKQRQWLAIQSRRLNENKAIVNGS
jgi:hypothetical protein